MLKQIDIEHDDYDDVINTITNSLTLKYKDEIVNNDGIGCYEYAGSSEYSIGHTWVGGQLMFTIPKLLDIETLVDVINSNSILKKIIMKNSRYDGDITSFEFSIKILDDVFQFDVYYQIEIE